MSNQSNEKKKYQGPNLFSFATSELSQNAVIAWLLAWADESYNQINPSIHLLGKRVIAMFTGMNPEKIHSIKVLKQWNNIDILAEINDDTVLVIEDKTKTTAHSNQLERYREITENHYRAKRRDKIHFVYFKSDNEPESILLAIKQKGYLAKDRREMLDVLNSYEGDDSIINDYRSYLQEIENATQSFLTEPVSEWRWYQWQGFYKELEKHIGVESWGYVPNRTGGFIGLW